MSRFALRSVGIIAGGGCVAIVALILVAYLPLGEGLRKAAAERVLASVWGEPVAVRGTVRVELWPRAVIEIANIEAHGSDGSAARVDHLVFTTPAYGEIVTGSLRYGVALRGARFDLPLGGTDAAEPGSLLESPIYVLSLLPHLVAHDVLVRSADSQRGWLFELKVVDLTSVLGPERSALEANVVLDGQPLTFSFAFDLEVRQGEGERPYGAEIRVASVDKAKGLSARLDVRAPTARFDSGLVMELDGQANSLAQLLRLARIAPSVDGSGTVRAHLEAEPGRLGLTDLDLALRFVDGERVTVTGHAADLASLSGADLKVVAVLDDGAAAAVSLRDIVVTRLSGAFRTRPEGMMLDDMLLETNAFDQSFREIGPIRVGSVERDPVGHVAFKDMAVRVGSPDRPLALLAGSVNDVLGLSGIALSGRVDIPVASLLDLPAEAKLGRVVGTLAVSDDGGGLGVDQFAVRVEGSALAEASLALMLDDLARPGVAASARVDARLRVPNYAAFAAALGGSSAFKGPLTFEGHLSGTTDALTVDGRTDIGRTRIVGRLTSLGAPGGRSLVKGAIRSALVYGDEILAFARPEGRRASRPLALAGASAPAGGSRIDLIGSTDADMTITAARLDGGGDSARGIQARLTVKDGALRVDPLRIMYRGGVISAVIASEGRSVLRVRGTGEGWPLAAFLGRRSSIPVSGTLRAAFDLTTRPGAGDPLATLNGTLTGRVRGGRLGTGLLDLAGVGLVAGLFTDSVHKGESELRCLKVPLVFQNGVGRTNPMIVLNTQNVQALARGTVDLVRGRVDLHVVPRPLNDPNGEAGYSFTIKGPLAGPSIVRGSGGGDLRGRYGCDN